MRSMIFGVTLVLAISTLAACGKREKAGDALADSIDQSLVLGLSKDQYKAAKDKFDKGEDATAECFMDTTELKKNTSAEALQLAKDFDHLCKVDVPATVAMKDLDEKFQGVDKDKKARSSMLASDQVLLKFSCNEADETLAKMTSAGMGAEPKATALSDAKTKICTSDNLESRSASAAKAKRKK